MAISRRSYSPPLAHQTNKQSRRVHFEDEIRGRSRHRDPCMVQKDSKNNEAPRTYGHRRTYYQYHHHSHSSPRPRSRSLEQRTPTTIRPSHRSNSQKRSSFLPRYPTYTYTYDRSPHRSVDPHSKEVHRYNNLTSSPNASRSRTYSYDDTPPKSHRLKRFVSKHRLEDYYPRDAAQTHEQKRKDKNTKYEYRYYHRYHRYHPELVTNDNKERIPSLRSRSRYEGESAPSNSDVHVDHKHILRTSSPRSRSPRFSHAHHAGTWKRGSSGGSGGGRSGRENKFHDSNHAYESSSCCGDETRRYRCYETARSSPPRRRRLRLECSAVPDERCYHRDVYYRRVFGHASRPLFVVGPRLRSWS